MKYLNVKNIKYLIPRNPYSHHLAPYKAKYRKKLSKKKLQRRLLQKMLLRTWESYYLNGFGQIGNLCKRNLVLNFKFGVFLFQI